MRPPFTLPDFTRDHVRHWTATSLRPAERIREPLGNVSSADDEYRVPLMGRLQTDRSGVIFKVGESGDCHFQRAALEQPLPTPPIASYHQSVPSPHTGHSRADRAQRGQDQMASLLMALYHRRPRLSTSHWSGIPALRTSSKRSLRPHTHRRQGRVSHRGSRVCYRIRPLLLPAPSLDSLPRPRTHATCETGALTSVLLCVTNG